MVPSVRPAERRRRSAIAAAWDRAAGPELALETRPATLQRGVLTVEVKSTSLLAELQGFRRDELLSRLLEADPSARITGLRFRPGVF
jgi:predicted nucleic acid-binding Zn ribbon protein